MLGLVGCGLLAWQATPLGGSGWQRGRLLYAGAGSIPALALLGIAAMGFALRRQARHVAAMRAALERIEKRLEG